MLIQSLILILFLQIELTPIENATEAIESRIDALLSETRTNNPNTKTLQPVIQGTTRLRKSNKLNHNNNNNHHHNSTEKQISYSISSSFYIYIYGMLKGVSSQLFGNSRYACN